MREQADLFQTPNVAMEEFCASNPDAEFLSAHVTRRATVYTWNCVGGQAVAGYAFYREPLTQ